MRRYQLNQIKHLFGRRVLAILMIGFVVTAAIPSLAQFRPSNRGLPGRREGGGTRGGCPLQQPKLTALIPPSNLGQTLAPYPTFFWYLPQNAATAAEFVLLDANNAEIYKTQVTLPAEAGVVSLTLPQDLAPDRLLEVGQSYRWYFSLICDPLDRSADMFTSGWVERVEPSAELNNALAVALAADVPNLYAKAGLWYDALAATASLRQSQPQNPAFVSEWQNLLQAVGLEALANQPMLSVDLAAPQPSPSGSKQL